MQGFWVSAEDVSDRHDCATAGHMPDACPGGQLKQSDQPDCTSTNRDCQCYTYQWGLNDVVGSLPSGRSPSDQFPCRAGVDCATVLGSSQTSENKACARAIGSVCSPGYWGDRCTKCCKTFSTCPELRGKTNPDTRAEYRPSWYYTEAEGRCKECPEQNVLQLAVFGVVIALFVAEKLLQFAEVAKLSGALHAPLVSLVNFFQLCDL